MAVSLDSDARQRLQSSLLDLEGVEYAGLLDGTGTLWIVRSALHTGPPIELAVRTQLATLGYDPASFDIQVAGPISSGPRRRVRFEGVERVEDHIRVTITVRLEWDGEVHSGSASGESGPAIELKTTAHAAVAALQKLTGRQLALRIIGVKTVRAFDSDLMVASLIRSEPAPAQRLVGAVIVSGDPLDAAALSVLSALNRTLGNFLHTPD